MKSNPPLLPIGNLQIDSLNPANTPLKEGIPYTIKLKQAY